MTDFANARFSRSKARSAAPWPGFLAVLFLASCLLAVWGRPWDVFLADVHDEGYNCVKGWLMAHGYELYAEIWSDQPPLFSAIVAWGVLIFGNQIDPFRFLVLGFSGLLAASVYGFAATRWSGWCGFLAAAFLVSTYYYARLSVSILIGLPAMSLGMFALFCAALYARDSRKRALDIAAVFFGLSLLTKLFTIPLAAVFGWLIFSVRSGPRSITNDLFRFALVSAATFFGIWLCITPDLKTGLGNVFSPHVAARGHAGFDAGASLVRLYNLLRCDEILAGFAIVCGAAATAGGALRKKPGPMLEFGWFSLFFLVLYWHEPVWDHHYLLLSVPLSLLAAATLASWGVFPTPDRPPRQWLREALRRPATYAALTLLALWVLSLSYPIEKMREFHRHAALTEIRARVLNAIPAAKGTGTIISALANEADNLPPDKNKDMEKGTGNMWMATDAQFFAFYTGYLVPPRLAVTSDKRRWAGDLGPEDFQQAIRKYRPRVLLFSDVFPAAEILGPDAMARTGETGGIDGTVVNGAYTLVVNNPELTLFIRRE